MKKTLLLLFIIAGQLPNDAKTQDVRWSPNHVYYGQRGALSYTPDALGNTSEGSVIVAAGTSTRDLIVIDNGSSLSIDFGSRVDITESYVPVGRKFLLVSNTSTYSAGDHIALYRPGTREWISDIGMDQITPGEDIVQWDPASYSFYFERLLTRVSGDTLFFRNPVVMAMESQYGGGAVYKVGFDRLEKVGVEDLCLKSAYTSDTDEAHSWKAIVFKVWKTAGHVESAPGALLTPVYRWKRTAGSSLY